MCFVNGKPKTSWIIPNQNVLFRGRPAPCPRLLCRVTVDRQPTAEGTKREATHLPFESALINSSHALLRDLVVHGARMLQVRSLLIPVVVIILQVGRRRAVRRLWRLGPTDWRVLGGAVIPNCGGGRGVASHGVAGVGTVIQGDLAVLVQFLELGSPVLEPDLHLKQINYIFRKWNNKTDFFVQIVII